MDEIINYLQLTANAFALMVAGWVYIAYIKNLNSTSKLKDEQIKTVEKNMRFWEDKAEELEKKSPGNIEKILNDRIRVREDEIERLGYDKESHKKELEIKNQELVRLKSEVEKTKDVRRTIDLIEMGFEDHEFYSEESEYEIEEMGMVAVDSGQLMITDPAYIDSDWKKEEFEDLRLYKDIQTSNIFQFRRDFKRYDEKIEGYNQSVNELIQSGRFEAIEVDNSKKVKFSYAGACYATQSKNGYGSMPFQLGHEGAGIAIGTILGDGMYPVYGEKYNGKIVRVYFNLL